MEKPERFSEEEWEMLSSFPLLIGSAAAGAGRSGLFGTFKEAMASIKGIMEGISLYPSNTLITAMVPEKEDLDDSKEAIKEQHEYLAEKMKEKGVKKSEEIVTMAMEELQLVLPILEQHVSAQESMEYKQWLLHIAQKVAESAKEGDFLGIGGVRVSEEEQRFLEELKMNLKL